MERTAIIDSRSLGADPVGYPEAVTTGRRSAFSEVMRRRNFRLRLIGGTISCLGDQFYIIALPWLVLQLTGNAFAMGTVLALAGVPRALFMLVGGALTDRFSPRSVMIASNAIRMVVVGLMTLMVLAGAIELWMLYLFALVFGLADAFFYPAMNAIMPQLVARDHLHIGNAVMQGAAQVAIFVGPVLAGALIALVDGGRASGAATADIIPNVQGIGFAFAINTLTFFVSMMTLWMMRINAPKWADEATPQGNGLLASIREVLVSVWNDVVLRTFFLVVAAINLLTNGPFIVGIPVLANTRFLEGAVAYGIVMSAWGGGSLIGTALAAVLPRPKPGRMGLRLLGLVGLQGVCMALLGLTGSTAMAATFSLAMGATSGYVVILFMTWLQRRTPQAMLGRVMSLLMFAAVGMMPISISVAGAMVDLNTTAVFVVAGSAAVLITAWSALNPAVRSVDVSSEQPA